MRRTVENEREIPSVFRAVGSRRKIPHRSLQVGHDPTFIDIVVSIFQ